MPPEHIDRPLPPGRGSVSRWEHVADSEPRAFVTGVAAAAIGIYAEIPKNDPVKPAMEKGLKWLVSVQGKDGGWGQDGGETSYVRQGERLESNGNDVANTAVAAEALLHADNTFTSGPYHESLQSAV